MPVSVQFICSTLAIDVDNIDALCEEKGCQGQCASESGAAECFCPIGQTVNPKRDTECVSKLLYYYMVQIL